MPQNPILVFEKETGTPAYMHTVDAAEAVKYGDYTPVPPGEVTPEARASALSRFATGQAMTHPELMTDEEKAAARQKANEEAAVFAGLPPGTPIVVQAPSDRPATRAAGGAGSASSSGGSATPAQERAPRRESSS